MTPETSRTGSLIGCGHKDRGRCGGGLLGFWLDSLDDTGQKQDAKAQGRDPGEAGAFGGGGRKCQTRIRTCKGEITCGTSKYIRLEARRERSGLEIKVWESPWPVWFSL